MSSNPQRFSAKVCPVCKGQFPPGANYCPHDGHALQETLLHDALAVDPLVGTTFDDRYRMESQLGQGGMGVVYRARHVIIDKPVAIKLLRQEFCKKEGLVERFVREARAASRIGHPNIVDVTDFGLLENGQVYLVMEYLEGGTLAHELRQLDERVERMPLSRVLDLTIQVCQGLSAAHAKGIVHRDLKPDNIFIVGPTNEAVLLNAKGYRQDYVKLLDFGIARFTVETVRLTQMGSVFGTPQYMSPEQAAGEDADQRGDIYSLGCILYELLTGRAPLVADTYMGTITKQIHETPCPPRDLCPNAPLPGLLEEIVMRMLAKNPADRYASMELVVEALWRCFRQPPEAAAPPDETFPPGDTEPVLRPRRPGSTGYDLLESDEAVVATERGAPTSARSAMKTVVWTSLMVGVAIAGAIALWHSGPPEKPSTIAADTVNGAYEARSAEAGPATADLGASRARDGGLPEGEPPPSKEDLMNPFSAPGR